MTDRQDLVEAGRSRPAGRGVELALDVSGGRGTSAKAEGVFEVLLEREGIKAIVTPE